MSILCLIKSLFKLRVNPDKNKTLNNKWFGSLPVNAKSTTKITALQR